MIPRAQADTFADRLESYRARTEGALESALSGDATMPERLQQAMNYSVLGGGKRVRPLLAYASAELGELEPSSVDAIAASVELVHAYSLIHDDLPAMDDDDLRRGRPTVHKAFDEATAILAGDALQALAFETLCLDETLSRDAAAQIRIICWLARAIGPSGMVGGQALDLAAENSRVDEDALEEIHRRKTGQLIRAAIMMPSELSELKEAQRERLNYFAGSIGLVFQIRDDLLEIDQDTETLGKNAKSDDEKNKSTYPSILGVEQARTKAEITYASAWQALDCLGERAQGLRWLADFIMSRTY